MDKVKYGDLTCSFVGIWFWGFRWKRDSLDRSKVAEWGITRVIMLHQAGWRPSIRLEGQNLNIFTGIWPRRRNDQGKGEMRNYHPS